MNSKLNNPKKREQRINELQKKYPEINLTTPKFSNSTKKAFYSPETNEKICAKCDEKKSTKLFWNHKGTTDGYHSWCKDCCRIGGKKTLKKKYSNFENRLTTLLYTSLVNSKKRKQTFGIDKNFLKKLWEKQDKKCFYTDILMTTRPNHLFSVSIERKNSNLGYIPKNTVLVCNAVNRMKSDFNVNEFFYFCGLITKYNEC